MAGPVGAGGHFSGSSIPRHCRSSATPTPLSVMFRDRALRTLATSMTVAGLAACSGEGDSPPAGPISTFVPGYDLRQDVLLGTGAINEAVVLDIDGDGRDDVLEADFNDSRITSALSNPDGSFTPLHVLPLPGAPWQIDLGDYDGDGNRDFATITTKALGGSDTLVIYLGLGDGSFQQSAVQLLPEEPFDLHTVRLPGQDRDDLFVAMPLAFETAHFRYTSPGVLTRVGTLASSQNGVYVPITIAAVDADGDDFRDLVVGEMDGPEFGPDRVVTHRYEPGSATFLPPTVLVPSADYPIVRAVGDTDGDGFEDVAVAQLEDDRVLLFTGGASGFGTPVVLQFPGAAASILFEDLNEDGLRDVAVTLFGEDAVGVRLASAPLVFGDLDVYNVGGAPRSIATGRFGDDDVVDLFCSNIRDVSVLHGDGTGHYEAARGYPVGNDPLFVRPADLDNDGDVDVVSMDIFKGKIVFMLGDGAGGFTNVGEVALDPSTLEWPGFVIARDFDDDGFLDIATAVNSGGRISITHSPASGSFSSPALQSSVTVGSEPVGLDAADLDGDGHEDLIVANSGDRTVETLLSNGDGTFQSRETRSCPFPPIVVTTADFDADGYLDVAATTRELDGSNTSLVLYRGDGLGGLIEVAQQPLPRFSPVLSVADFNEDGLPDLVGSQPDIHANELLVLINQEGFGFHVRPLVVGFRMGTLEVTDANRDGHQDILVPLASGQLVIALGDGSGAFPVLLPPFGEQFPAPRGATTSALADVNGDGLLDLLTVSPRHQHLWVALNNGKPFE